MVATLPPEVLNSIFDHFNVKDLLCASLVNRGWRAACLARQILWHRHWETLDLDAVDRHRTLAKEDVDWFAEGEGYVHVGLTPVAAHVRTESAWETGNFTTRFIDLPPAFRSIDSVVADTAFITTARPMAEDEKPAAWKDTVDVFHLADPDTFEILQTIPELPGQFHQTMHIDGLGIVLSIVEYPRNYYYITEDAYEWLGRPAKEKGGKLKWPKIPGFVFLGGKEIQSEDVVNLHVDGAKGPTPKLIIHEQDTDNLNWVRWGPWKGRNKILQHGDESFLDHCLTDDCVIITSHAHMMIVRHRESGKQRSLGANGIAAASYNLEAIACELEDLAFEPFMATFKDIAPSSDVLQASKADGGKTEELLGIGEDDYTFKGVVAVGKHLFCAVDSAIVVFRDYAGPLYGRSALAPVVITLGGSKMRLTASGHRLIISALATLFVLNAGQFDNVAVPESITALQLNRWGIVHGSHNYLPERGATAELVVTPSAIYEHIKINEQGWNKDMKERVAHHLLRVYEFA